MTVIIHNQRIWEDKNDFIRGIKGLCLILDSKLFP